jgi:hypothetical protein
MSIPLPQVNLAGATVGQTGTVSFANVGISAGGVSANPSVIPNAGTLHIYNESGSGLLFQFQTSGDGFILPAGAWIDKVVKAGEAGLNYTVLYNLPNPPVTLLLITYYGPNEPIPTTPSLGNSPIGIGGTIATSFTTLSNETNTAQTLVIDIGQQGNTNLINIFSDGSFVWSVLQGGVAHQVLKGNISGSPLQIGKAGDVAEFLGNPLLDNNIALEIKDSTGTTQPVLLMDNTNQVVLEGNTAGTGVVLSSSPGSAIWKITNTGPQLLSGSINLLGGSISRQNGNLINCGSGTTISHGLGTTPTWVLGTPSIAQPGSATVGVGGPPNGSTFVATVGAGVQIEWVAGVL